MQILMPAAALMRVEERCKKIAPNVEVVALHANGSLTVGGKPAGRVRPEGAWLSREREGAYALRTMVDVILAAGSVQWVQTYHAGLDNPIYGELAAQGIRIARSDAQAPAIAEYVLAHALSLLYPIAEQRTLQQTRAWRRTPFREIANSHFVLVGFGAIGRAIASRLAPFGPDVTVVRRSRGEEDGYASLTLADLPGVLATADVVVLACALNDETGGLADEAFFAAMKPGAIFINIARGALVDEAALRRGLARGQPRFAVLDVFKEEPLSPESWLWDHPNVRVTAHTSSEGDAVVRRVDELFLDNLARYCAGERLRNEA